jgi:hypothetical protein
MPLPRTLMIKHPVDAQRKRAADPAFSGTRHII